MKKEELEAKIEELTETLNHPELFEDDKQYDKARKKYNKLIRKWKFKDCVTNYKFWILLVLLAGFIVYTVFHTSTNRFFIKSLKEIWDSLVYYFQSMFSSDTISNENVSFLEFDETIITSVLPTNIDVFGYRFLATFQIMFSKPFLIDSWSSFVLFLNNLLILFMLIGLPLIIGLILYYEFVIFKTNDKDSSSVSPTLAFGRKVHEKVWRHVKCFFIEFYETFRYTKIIFGPFLLLALYNLNLISMALIFFAWYFYFVFSIDFTSLWYLLCKVLMCITPLLRPIFVPLWILLAIVIIIKLKIAAGYRNLEDMYAQNDDFVEDLGVVTGIYGPPGSGKNLLETQIAVQAEVMLRRQAEEQLMEIRAEFPNFPFRFLEEDVETLKENNKAVNKVQVEDYFTQEFKKDKEFIYTYELNKNKTEHYDNLCVRKIQEELLDYAKLYYVYISDLGISTYSLRYDKGIMLTGHHPGLIYDHFHRDLRDKELDSRAKIMNLNLLRMNQQLVEETRNNPSKDKNTITLVDFGLITLSEFAKERGNRYTNRTRDKNDVSPSSDGTTNAFGIIRHLTTIRHKQYCRIIWDEQKLSSFSGVEGAMAETNIFLSKQKTKSKLALNFWFIESVILEWFYSHYQKQYTRYIAIRNDNNFFSWYFSHMYGFFANKIRNITNTFGYRKISLGLSGVNINGAQEKRDDRGIYLLNKIIYADRYETDCYRGFFNKLKMQATIGVNQLEPFRHRAATQHELEETNGYFVSELVESLIKYVAANEEKLKHVNDSGDPETDTNEGQNKGTEA